MRIVEIREQTVPISSPIRNAYIDFSKMTLSLVAVVTDVIRDGKPVVGYGFNSNGRYGQGMLMRERFIPRILEADPVSLMNDAGTNLDPHKVWDCMYTNEKPGGHGELGCGGQDRRQAAVPAAGGPLRQRHAGQEDLRLRGGRLLLSGPEPRCAEGRDAQLYRSRLHGGEEEDRRRLAGRGPAPHRFHPQRAGRRPEAGGGRQRPLRPRYRHRLCQGLVAVRSVLV